MSALVLCTLSGCGTETPSNTPGGQGSYFVYTVDPVIQADNDLLQLRVPLPNRTDRTIHILKTTGSCACSRIEAEPTTLTPGESGQLLIDVSAHPLRSELTTISARIRSDDSDRPDWLYHVRIPFFRPLEVDADSLVFPDIGAKTSPEKSLCVTVHSLGSQPLPPIELRNVPKLFSVTPSHAIDDWVSTNQLSIRRRRQRFRLQPVPPLESVRGGPSSAIIQVVARCETEDSKVAQLDLPIQWSFRPPITAEPESLFLSVGDSGFAAASLSLLSVDEQPFHVISARSDNESIVCDWATTAERKHTIRVVATSAAGTLASLARIHVVTDCHDAPRLTIPLHVFYANAAARSVPPDK